MSAREPNQQRVRRWGSLALFAVLLLLTVALLAFWSPHKQGQTDDEQHSGAAPAAPPWFADVTKDMGLDFVHDPGPVDERYFMPQIVGSGAALLDFDGDDLLDIYLLNNGGSKGRPNVLYQQLPGGKFRDVSRGSGLDFAGYCMGVAVGDVNNDGLPDVTVTEFGKLQLFVNEGDGRFALPQNLA